MKYWYGSTVFHTEDEVLGAAYRTTTHYSRECGWWHQHQEPERQGTT